MNSQSQNFHEFRRYEVVIAYKLIFYFYFYFSGCQAAKYKYLVGGSTCSYFLSHMHA